MLSASAKSTASSTLPRSRSCNVLGNRHGAASKDRGYCSTGAATDADNELPIFLDEVILHRIAFTVWHTALHLQQEHQVCAPTFQQ